MWCAAANPARAVPLFGRSVVTGSGAWASTSRTATRGGRPGRVRTRRRARLAWFFREWLPADADDPEERLPEHLADVEVALTPDGLPDWWSDADGQYPVLRVLAHWQATEGDGTGG